MTYPNEIRRYHLYGHEEGWVCEEPPLYTSDEVYDCILYSNANPMNFMFVIDRYFPQVPIYLNRKNDYRPHEDLGELATEDFPVIQKLIEGGLCLVHIERVP